MLHNYEQPVLNPSRSSHKPHNTKLIQPPISNELAPLSHPPPYHRGPHLQNLLLSGYKKGSINAKAGIDNKYGGTISDGKDKDVMEHMKKWFATRSVDSTWVVVEASCNSR